MYTFFSILYFVLGAQLNLKEKNSQNDTILHSALRYNNTFEVIQLLLREGNY